jgi:hypothetical protein
VSRGIIHISLKKGEITGTVESITKETLAGYSYGK